MYVVEVVASVTAVLSVVARTTNYDFALAVFDSRKKTGAREVRMVKVESGRRAVLKYVDKTRAGR